MIGKIYILRSNETDKFYIGSTIKNLTVRLTCHKSHYKSFINKKFNYITSFEIVKYADAWIQLIDTIEIDDKNELYELEKTYIENLFDDSNCVNKCYIKRSKTQEYKKRMNDKHTTLRGEKYVKYQRQWREKNKDKQTIYRLKRLLKLEKQKHKI